jgi:hypothetical protein
VELLLCFVSSIVVVSRVMAVLMFQSNRLVRIVVRQPVLMSQSNWVSLIYCFFFYFFLPMISQDHSLVFFSTISMKHALWFAQKNILVL